MKRRSIVTWLLIVVIVIVFLGVLVVLPNYLGSINSTQEKYVQVLDVTDSGKIVDNQYVTFKTVRILDTNGKMFILIADDDFIIPFSSKTTGVESQTNHLEIGKYYYLKVYIDNGYQNSSHLIDIIST